MAFLVHDGQAMAILDPAGPLSEIHVSRVRPLDCQVMHVNVTYDAPLAESDGEFWGFGSPSATNACGTFLRMGGTTYGPNVGGFAAFGNPVPAGFTPVDQTFSGSG